MHCYRITKYNPKNRNTKGHYLLDEWTSFSDVGKLFCGKYLTQNAYSKIENAYLDVIVYYLKSAKIRYLNISYHHFEVLKPKKIKNHKLVTLIQARKILKHNLRDYYWCQLEVPNKLAIHVGYDYYMYLKTGTLSAGWKSLAKRRGLFVENIKLFF